MKYRNPKFWENFHAQHWQPQIPTVIRQAFEEFPFSEELLLRSLNCYADGLRAGDQRKPCLVSIGDSERAPRRPLRELFRKKSHSFEELEQNCSALFSKQNFGLMVNQMQSVDPGIWHAISAFLQDARNHITFPIPRAFLDLFYGNYSSAFTGLHKDTQEIIAFVVRGEKRILAWPFDYFISKVAGVGPGDKYFNKRLPIDHRKYRKDALVLDARPGDIIYWPSDYWHVAEAQPGKFTAMLSLGLFRPESRGAAPPPSPFTRKLLATDLRAEDSQLSALRSQAMTDVITRPDAAAQLRWATGFGFEHGGPMMESPPITAGTAARKVSVVKNSSSVILWKLNSASGRILIASNGKSITLPHSAKVLNFLERIASGEEVTLSKALQDKSDKLAKIFETNFDKNCVLKSHKVMTHRDSRVFLVDWLVRTCAVTLVG